MVAFGRQWIIHVYVSAQGYVDLAYQDYFEAHGRRGSKLGVDVAVGVHGIRY